MAEPVVISILPSTQFYLARRRQLAAAEGAAASPQGHLHEHRQLVAWTPDTCYDACRARLNNPPTCVASRDDELRMARRLDDPSAYSCSHVPSQHAHTRFIINIYNDPTNNNTQVCTCCLVCEGWRYVPGAQIFAGTFAMLHQIHACARQRILSPSIGRPTVAHNPCQHTACAAGDGTNSLVSYKPKASHQKAGVKPGTSFIYTATVKNTNKAIAVSGLAVEVQLPVTGVTYLASKTTKAYIISPKQGPKGKTRYSTIKGLTAVYNARSVPPTVTWSGLALPPRKWVLFIVHVRVDALGVYRGMPLTFSGRVYQELSVNGLPYCSSTFKNTTVRVR
jgi:hypothetical protein